MPEPHAEELNPEIRHIVDAARSVWTRRLIDYSRTNSLLFHRDLKAGTLDLSTETEAVDRLLAGDALTLELLAPAARSPETSEVTVAQAETAARRKVRGALVALQRKALSNLEEKGLETLCLALGMATWPAADGGRPYEAPILLLPARIEARGRTGDELRLLLTGEPQINPVLLYVIEETHGIRLDVNAVLSECGGEDDSGKWRIDPEGVAAHIARAAAAVPGFAVNRRAILANFQFAKMAMVEDLKRNADTIAASPIVAAVAGHPASRRHLAQAAANLDPAALDELPASDDYLVLDADSTQHRAIVQAGAGQNGVMQGPPGTGKSQTIANLMAQSVAEGRRVLFVAEKRAALEAVIKRLSHENVQLNHLVLDLHGASVSRKPVMARLAEALDHIRHAAPVDGADVVQREFEARRRQLNEHARRVNALRPPSDLSVSRMMGMLLRLPVVARSALRFRGDALAALTAERADEIKRSIVDGTAHPGLLLGTDPSPWNNAGIVDGRQAQGALDLAAKASELWPSFERMLGQVVQQLGVRDPGSLDEVAALLSVLHDARQLRARYAPELFGAQPAELGTGVGASHRWSGTPRLGVPGQEDLSSLPQAPARAAGRAGAVGNAAAGGAGGRGHPSPLARPCPTSAAPAEAPSEKELAAVFEDVRQRRRPHSAR